MHTGDKPYACGVEGCGFRCTQSGRLKAHQRIHTCDKPYECDFENCGYRCGERADLEKHKRTHTGEKPYACEFEDCIYRCTTVGALKIHKRRHSGEKPYMCVFEGREFQSATGGGLQSHMRIHSGDKPYACGFEGCDFRCSTSGNLKTHIGTWHVRCQSEACAFYDLAERGPGTSCVSSKRYCFYCVASLWPDMVRTRVRKEHHILAEIVRRVPELEAAAYHWQWDCPVQGGCSLKRPDLRFILPRFYIQIEVDEDGHEGYGCFNEDARLELIAVDTGKPGVVLRINPDAEPMLKRRKLKCGEVAWAATPSFVPVMDEVQGFLEGVLRRGDDVSNVERYSIAHPGDLQPTLC
jgi:hypothetical protein